MYDFCNEYRIINSEHNISTYFTGGVSINTPSPIAFVLVKISMFPN